MWHLNVLLYLLWFFNPPAYSAFVQAGAPCMSYMGDFASADPQPGCPYDPSNVNPFVP